MRNWELGNVQADGPFVTNVDKQNKYYIHTSPSICKGD